MISGMMMGHLTNLIWWFLGWYSGGLYNIKNKIKMEIYYYKKDLIKLNQNAQSMELWQEIILSDGSIDAVQLRSC
jgi:hypothetical protein